jgi:hypothetical protein
MFLEGGAIDLKDEVEITDVIEEILTDKDTTIKLLTKNHYTPAYLFTLSFDNSKFRKYFKKIPGSNSPSVLLLKIMAYEFLSPQLEIDLQEFSNEINQHKALSALDNIFPICPSFLHSEMTCNKDYTPIGNSINALLKRFDLYSTITQDILEKVSKHLAEKLKIPPHLVSSHITIKDVAQHIIIMEYYKCTDLGNFVKNYPRNYTLNNFFLYGIELPHFTLEEFSCFITLFITIIMLKRGFIHGDMHRGNILICTEQNIIENKVTKVNINPVVIDFGRTSRVGFENKFDTDFLVNSMEAIKQLELTKRKKILRIHPYFVEIYNKAIQIIHTEKLRTTIAPTTTQIPLHRITQLSSRQAHTRDDGIARLIYNLLGSGSYVEAALLSSMCCLPSFNNSVFFFYIESQMNRQPVSYGYMYYCKYKDEELQRRVWKSYDLLIKNLLEARDLKAQVLHKSTTRSIPIKTMTKAISEAISLAMAKATKTREAANRALTKTTRRMRNAVWGTTKKINEVKITGIVEARGKKLNKLQTKTKTRTKTRKRKSKAHK